MNRQQRRKIAKIKVTRETLDKYYGEASKLVAEKIRRENSEDIFQLLNICWVNAMHKQFGFGRERCLRALHAVDEQYGRIAKDPLAYSDMVEEVKANVGIEIYDSNGAWYRTREEEEEARKEG